VINADKGWYKIHNALTYFCNFIDTYIVGG